MAVAAEQIGREGSSGANPQRVLRYRATGAVTIAEAEGAILAQLQADLGGLTLDGLALTDIESDETDVAGHYLSRATFGIAKPIQEQGQNRLTFEFGQETVRASVAFDTRGYGAIPRNLINVRRNSDGSKVVEGIDVPSPSFSFGRQVILPLSSVDDLFMFVLGELHLHVNAQPFAGFAAREVLFQGATGAQRSETEMEISYRFARQPNIVNQTLGGIPGVTKFGWEYLEPVYQSIVGEDEQGNPFTLEAGLSGILVHELFPPADFSFFGA